MELKVIGHIETDFPEKFGIPRQSGLIDSLRGRIILEPEFRTMNAFRGLEQFSHIWLLWEFSESHQEKWHATVTPPRLGGRVHMGVFATRAPYRPNNIGLSCVRLISVEEDRKLGPVLTVAGADLMNGTPIFDIKPYIPLSDCHPEASEGYTKDTQKHSLTVNFPQKLLDLYPKDKQEAAIALLSQDPRPTYVMDPDRTYGVSFAGYDIKFRVEEAQLTVLDLIKLKSPLL